jgi:glycosyltransferase involved in cell wall biosynthesis
MKISVITVCKNAEKHIEKAITSVLSQTYSGVEYIIIDGDSKDSTKEIITQYSSEISQFISEPDSGVYEAMNKGISLATGEYVFFLNSDDCLADGKVLEDVAGFIRRHPDCDFVYGNLLFQAKNTNGLSSQLITFPQPSGLPDHLVDNCLLHQASFTKRKLFSKLGCFNEDYRIASDYEWFLRLVGNSSLKLYYYHRSIAIYNAHGMSSDMDKTLTEMFEIQNSASIYQSIDWMQNRIDKYQEILKNPQGRFGLYRMQDDHALEQRLQEAEATIAAMEASKFWKLRMAWFSLKNTLKTILLSPQHHSPSIIEEPELNDNLEKHQETSLENQEFTEYELLYANIREPKVDHAVTCTEIEADTIVQKLQELGISVEDYWIDLSDYQEYSKSARYEEDFPGYYSFNLPEKTLEHYIANKLLQLDSQDVYIDIASEGSPVPEIYSRLSGCQTYRQDLAYPAGLNGNSIGGNAANMPVPEGFATKMALHCSFEHFEQDSDIRFIRETERVLKSGGRACIVPLYLAPQYSIQTDPAVAVSQGVVFESDAIVHCASGWSNRHGRFYDPEHLVSRIYDKLDVMKLKLFRIRNAQSVDLSCYIKFAALMEKP